MKQTLIQKSDGLVQQSKLLKNWKEGQPIIHDNCFSHTQVNGYFGEVKSFAPDNFPQINWTGAHVIARVLRENGVPCQVLRGNGSTSPSGSDKAKNYFVIESDEGAWANKTNKLHLSFDMTVENAKRIVAILEAFYIDFVWSGDLGSCFIFSLNREGRFE